MDGYRVYLRGELGKLWNPDHARELLEGTACRLSTFGLPDNPEDLAVALPNQAAVDALVEVLGDAALVDLTDCYLWRNNGVPGKLRRSRTVEFRTVAVGDVTLSDAESELKPVFRELSRRLEKIATDPRVLSAIPYSMARRDVEYPVLLAEVDPEAPGSWRVFDGIHRAVQLYRNGDREIALCVIRAR